VPFFGTVLADGIDVAALAAGWGGSGSRRDDAGVLGGGGSADGPVPAGMAGTTPGSSAPPGQARWQALEGQGLPAMTREPGPAPATERKGAPRPRQNAEATSGVVTRLDQGLDARCRASAHRRRRGGRRGAGAGRVMVCDGTPTDAGASDGACAGRTAPREFMPPVHASKTRNWGIHLTGVGRRLGQWNVPSRRDNADIRPHWRDLRRAARGGKSRTPVKWTPQTRKMEITTKTLRSGRRDVRGRSAARRRLFCAAGLVRVYLAPALAARPATSPCEFMPPVHASKTRKMEITTKTLRSGRRDARRRSAARPRLFCAAGLVRVHLPPALAARLATVPTEFMPPVHASKTRKMEITTKTLRSGRWDARRRFAARPRLFCAVELVRVYLPPALAARLATSAPEFMPPVHASKTRKMEITTKTLRSGRRDARGRLTARPRAALCGRAAERLAEGGGGGLGAVAGGPRARRGAARRAARASAAEPTKWAAGAKRESPVTTLWNSQPRWSLPGSIVTRWGIFTRWGYDPVVRTPRERPGWAVAETDPSWWRFRWRWLWRGGGQGRISRRTVATLYNVRSPCGRPACAPAATARIRGKRCCSRNRVQPYPRATLMMSLPPVGLPPGYDPVVSGRRRRGVPA
jgi:hypothetical protein